MGSKKKPMQPALALQIQNTLQTLQQALAGHVQPCQPTPQKSVPEVCRELYDSRRTRGCGHFHLETLQHIGNRVARAFPGALAELTTASAERFLNSLHVQPRTWNNNLAYLRQLAAFAKRRRYLPPGWNELDALEKAMVPPVEPGIYTPAQAAVLFHGCFRSILPGALLIAFAGVRTAEMMRLDWGAVDLQRRRITISCAKAKTRARRICPIPDNLAAWLEWLGPQSGPIYGGTRKSFNELLRRARVRLGLPGVRNGLRHSFVSYRLALTADVGNVALEAGHSEAMLFGNYRALVTREAAAEWFGILPNVIEMPRQIELPLAA